MDFKKINDYELIYLARDGNENAKELLIDKYLPLIKKLASKYFPTLRGCGVEFDDLVQEGLITFTKVFKKYDESKNVLFYTYVSFCIEKHLITYCRDLNSPKHYCLNNNVGEDSLIYVSDNNFLDFDISFKDKYIRYKNSFDFLDSNIFELRYNGFTYKEIGLLLDLPLTLVERRLSSIRYYLRKKTNTYN